MKNIIRRFVTLSIFVSLLTTGVNAQTFNPFPKSFENNATYFSLGYGVITYFSTINRIFNSDSIIEISQYGTVYFKLEKGISDNFSIGINLAFVFNQWKMPGRSYSQYSDIIQRYAYSGLARVNYHFADSEKFDGYLGFGVGYRNAKWKYSANYPYNDELNIPFPFGFEFSIGGRYYLNPNIALYAEAGACKSIFQGGITYCIRSKQ